MYFPYLYGRRFELLALREILDQVDVKSLVPIVEPVVADPGDILRCLREYGKQAAPLIIIVNPDKHQLSDKKAGAAFRKNIHELFSEYPSLIPGLRCSADVEMPKVDNFRKIYESERLALLYSSPSFSNAEMRALTVVPSIAYHVVLQKSMSVAHLDLIPKKKRVEVTSCFNKLVRNSDYGRAEFFTDLHKTIPRDCVGVGDYTALGSTFTPGGGTPSAIAIHATFKHPKNEDIWVEHFVSDDVDPDVGSVAGKFIQAARKFLSAARARPAEFGDNFAIRYFEQQVRDNYFPGLPKNKQQQIMHHICLMLAVIDGDL
jgi:hypothetical protein